LADNTKPKTTDDAPSGWQASPVTVNLTGNDAGSGVNVTEYSVDGNVTYTVGTSVVIPAPADGSNDGSHTIAYFSVDNAGNIETVKSATVLIDATPPACPSCSAADYLRGTVTLSASPSAGGSGIKSVSFEYTDAAGNSTTSTVRNVTVDNVAPTPTLGDPGQNLSGTTSLSASSDPDSVQVDFERRPAGGGAWVTIASDSSLPWGAALDTTTLTDSLYDFRAIATDGTGHTGTSP